MVRHRCFGQTQVAYSFLALLNELEGGIDVSFAAAAAERSVFQEIDLRDFASALGVIVL